MRTPLPRLLTLEEAQDLGARAVRDPSAVTLDDLLAVAQHVSMLEAEGPRAIEELISAARGLGPDVCDVSVSLLSSGASVRLMTNSEDAARRLGEKLGCSTSRWASDGRSEWVCAERGEYGDPIVLTVTGGHRPVCQCHPRKAG